MVHVLGSTYVLGKLKQEAHRLLEGSSSLKQFRFIGVVGEKDLAVCDVLIDLVLRVLRIRVSYVPDLVSKS